MSNFFRKSLIIGISILYFMMGIIVTWKGEIFLPSIPKYQTLILGIAMIVYGIFRIVRVYLRNKKEE